MKLFPQGLIPLFSGLIKIHTAGRAFNNALVAERQQIIAVRFINAAESPPGGVDGYMKSN